MIEQHSSLSPLETRIVGTFSSRFRQELLGNSLHFPIANLLFEVLSEGGNYLITPDMYVLILGGVVQAYFLTKWQMSSRPRRLLGNLIGPALYTCIEVAFEGIYTFFAAPHHVAYWIVSFIIGTVQSVRLKLPIPFTNVLIVIESVVRTSILFVMYAIFERFAHPAQTIDLDAFFADPSHVFIAWTILLFGIAIGLANAGLESYLRLLKTTLAQLRIYSEWLLGHRLLEQSLNDSSVLTVKRQERTVLFMDIRNFTPWSEAHSPEDVMQLLTQYYQAVENVLVHSPVIKFKVSADEVMAIFPTSTVAVQVAVALRRCVREVLHHFNLGVDIGIHKGVVVEGLIGATSVKFYDVIGDTVNTSKRIESSAKMGEILISEHVAGEIGQLFPISYQRQISVKGKQSPVIVYCLEETEISVVRDRPTYPQQDQSVEHHV